MQRMVWMDAFRGLCILMIFFLHANVIVFLISEDFVGSNIISEINKILSPFRMPTLMFLSGFLFYKSYKKGAKIFFKGKFNNILWPYIVWTPITLLVMDQLTFKNIVLSPLFPPTFLWFLWFLFAYYCLVYIIEKVKIPYVPVFITSILIVIFAPDFARIPRFFFLFIFFLFGHLFNKYKLWEKINNKNIILAAIILLVQMCFLIKSDYDIRYKVDFLPMSIAFIIIAFYFSKYYQTNNFSKPIEFVGRNSIFYFVLHFPIQYALSKFLIERGGSFELIFIFNMALPLVIATLFVHLSNKYRYIEYIFKLKI